MATVRVEPSGIEFDVDPDETILAAAVRHRVRWPTICEGAGTCRTCILTVVEGDDLFDEARSWEREGLADAAEHWPGDPARLRMACQAGITGDVTVRKPGVRRLG